MKRRHEFLVGLVVVAAIVIAVAGALWLGEADVGRSSTRAVARFRSVGALSVGAPVTVRGVKVGRVEQIRLAKDQWVEAVLLLEVGTEMPKRPAVIASSKSLFGEWQADIIPLDPLPDDPAVRADLVAAMRAGAGVWPGATLPDIGALTAQASRIAGDISRATGAINEALDSTAVRNFKHSIGRLASATDKLQGFADKQVARYDSVGLDVKATTGAVARVATRFDSLTAGPQLGQLRDNAAASAADLRAAAADLRSVLQRAHENEASMVNVVQAADRLLTKLEQGQGTLGLLATDSTLYRETTQTMREVRSLVEDIRRNPKRYLKLSLF